MNVKNMFLAAILFVSPLFAGNYVDPRETSNRCGVLDFLGWDQDWNNHHYTWENIQKAAELMRQAHVGMVRMDFAWTDVEPKPGRFDFGRYDRIVDLLRSKGIQVLGTLEYNPAWRQAAWNAAPEPKLYVRYAKAVVHHFKDRVKYWEIWNEPDYGTYWQPQDNLATYCKLLKKAYPAIKREDPTALVLEGSLSQMILTSQRDIYQEAGPESFDIVNVHLFPNPLDNVSLAQARDQLQSLKRIMAEFGDQDKPIWITELGCPGVPLQSANINWWAGKSPTENEQAAWVSKVIPEVLKAPGVDKVFWAFFRDTDGFFNNGIDYFGLIRSDFTLKPAYESFKKTASE